MNSSEVLNKVEKKFECPKCKTLGKYIITQFPNKEEPKYKLRCHVCANIYYVGPWEHITT